MTADMAMPPERIDHNRRRYAHIFPLSVRATGAHLTIEFHVRPDGEVLLVPAGEAMRPYRAGDIDDAVATLRVLLERAADAIYDRQLGE